MYTELSLSCNHFIIEKEEKWRRNKRSSFLNWTFIRNEDVTAYALNDQDLELVLIVYHDSTILFEFLNISVHYHTNSYQQTCICGIVALNSSEQNVHKICM